MSRFSMKEAEALGWHFVHHKPEEVIDLGDGITRTIPADLRAEKSLPGGGMVNEQAETLGLLLERIHAWEEHQAGLPVMTTPEFEAVRLYGDLSPGRVEEEPEEEIDHQLELF